MKTFYLTLCMAVLLAGAVRGWAGNTEGQKGRDAGCFTGRTEKCLAAELGLAGEKSAELKEKMQEMRKKIAGLKSEHDTAMASLDKLLQADPIDEAAVWKAFDELRRIEAQMLKVRISTRLEVSKNLTPEQRKRMAEMRAKMEQKRRERMEKIRERGEKAAETVPEK